MVTETYPSGTEASPRGDGCAVPPSGTIASTERQKARRPEGRGTTMRTTRIHKGLILGTAAALLLGLGAIGAAASLGGRPASDRGTTPGGTAPTSVATTPDPATARPSPQSPSVSPTAQPTVDPNELADGVYPTYISEVDVRGATITVDVLQTFFGADAHQAAIEDGVSWRDVRYDPVYIRNENPLLRTLPVARDVKIKLIGMCMAPNRAVGLEELSEATTPFTDTLYYDVTVVSGTVQRVNQLVAVSAC
jgi:hypothetical protein